MDKRKFFKILLIILILVGGVSLGIVLFGNTERTGEKEPISFEQLASDAEECQILTEERIVRGNSLSPVINSGDTVKILFNYYDCHPIERDDVIVYHYAGNENPIIKIVKGLPGDSYELEETGPGEWHILINDQILKNSEDKQYSISDNRYKMLSLYEDDCQNGIPQNTYLLLGNLASGSQDSTRFGLVDKSDILGKVIYIET